MEYKIAQLSLAPGKNANTIGDIFIAQPDATKESLAGRLFVLVEIESKQADGLKIINFLIDNINYNYYQNEKIYLREKISSLKVEHIFEAALAKVNKNFLEYLKSEKIRINPEAININAGLIYENELYFSGSGKNRALLIYEAPEPRKDSPGTKARPDKISKKNKKEYKLSDVSKKTSAEDGLRPDDQNAPRLFNSVVSGKIPRRGFFVFTNEALPEYISEAQLIEVVTTLPPLGAVEQIKNTLAKINSYISFWGIIIKNTQFETSEEAKVFEPAMSDSVVDLSRTEEKTEKLLSPSGIINIKKLLAYPQAILGKNAGPGSVAGKNMMIKDKIFVKRKSLAKKINASVKNFFSYLLNFLFYAAKQLGRQKNLGGLFSALKTGLVHWKKTLFSFSGTATKRNKILLTLAALFLIVFAVNLFLIRTKNAKQEQQKNYEDLSLMIEQKQNQAEASLLYSNEEGAKKLFDEINGLMQSLPQATEEQKARFAEFTDKYNQQLEKIRHITRIDEPEEIADFSNLASQADPNNIILASGANKIYAADSGQKSIYILDVDKKLVTTATDLEKPITKLIFPALATNNVYYLNETDILGLNTKTEELNTFTIDLGMDGNYAGMDTYNERLYLLDNKNNRITRYTKNGQSFSSPYSWLQENIDLSEAVDLSIDGYIYILKTNGEVLKILRGAQAEFSLEAVDPPIEKAAKIFVSPDKYIYILDPKTERLILYDKTGQFRAQYTSKAFTDLRDFTVNETKDEVYLLNGTKVLKIKINEETL